MGNDISIPDISLRSNHGPAVEAAAEPEPEISTEVLSPEKELEANEALDLTKAKDTHSLENLHKEVDSETKAVPAKKLTGIAGELDRVFCNDGSLVRKIFALGNEIAESIEPAMEEMKLPKALHKSLYWGLWSLAIFATGTRTILSAMKGGAKHWKAEGLKKLTQDLIAAVGAPTFLARATNKIQEKLYAKGNVAKTLLASLGSLAACYFTIPQLDPLGHMAGKKLVQALKLKPLDPNEKVKHKTLSNWLLSMFNKKQAS